MKKLFSFLFAMSALFAWSQENSGISGKVVDNKTQQPLQGIVVTVLNTSLTSITNAEGAFEFDNVPGVAQIVEFRSEGYAIQLVNIELIKGQMLDIGMIVMDYDVTSEQQLSLITLTENDLGDDNSGSESTSGLLQASRDVFLQNAAFNFGQARFRVRGLDNEYGLTMINGVSMNKIYDGRPQWGNWGGLNDATRNQEFTNGMSPSDYAFGGILGTQTINTRASVFRPGSRVTFSSTNTNYSYRTMVTHASGMSESGWAYVVSGGRRWANEGYFEGTDYSANSLFVSVEKKIQRQTFVKLYGSLCSK